MILLISGWTLEGGFEEFEALRNIIDRIYNNQLGLFICIYEIESRDNEEGHTSIRIFVR
jgi:hypothetical protein